MQKWYTTVTVRELVIEAFVRAFGDLQIEEYENEYEYLCMLILF